MTEKYYLDAYGYNSHIVAKNVEFNCLQDAFEWVESHIITAKKNRSTYLEYDVSVCRGSIKLVRLYILKFERKWLDWLVDWISNGIIHIMIRPADHMDDAISPEQAAKLVATAPAIPSPQECLDMIIQSCGPARVGESRIEKMRRDNIWCSGYNSLAAAYKFHGFPGQTEMTRREECEKIDREKEDLMKKYPRPGI